MFFFLGGHFAVQPYGVRIPKAPAEKPAAATIGPTRFA